MEKFMLTLTKKNDRTVLAICKTKAEAMAKGEEFRKHLTMDSGTLAVISAAVDENNNMMGGKYKLYHVW